jgi:putative nucleotidyltransferase with HDIG domain
MNQADWAEEIARKHLEIPLPRRWAHSQGVATQARTLAPILGRDADLLEAAAWLHDIGYSPDLVDSGFHPLDGARHLRDAQQADAMLDRLVAHHSFAIIEAEERGLSGILLREFPLPPYDLAEALTYCDITTSPDGNRLSVHDRLAEIGTRYGPGHVVTRSVARSRPNLVMAAARVQRRMRHGLAEPDFAWAF